jgi:hypothetical protein
MELVLFYVAFTAFAARLFRSQLGAELVDGSPRWCAGVAALTQAFFFPLLLIMLVPKVGNDLDLLGAANSTIPEALLHYLNQCLFITVLYWLKDFLEPLSPLLLAHHAVCIFGVTVEMTLMDGARGWAVAKVVVYEIGGCARNILGLRPRQRRWVALYLATMTVSNAAGLYTVYRLCVASPALWVTAGTLGAMLPITYFRQKVAIEVYQEGWDDDAGSKGAGRKAE